MQPNLRKVAAGFAVFFAAIIGINIYFTPPTSRPATPRAAAAADDSVGAYLICKKFVTERLKAPASADFASILSSDTVRKGGDYVVRSYVDSQNSFGAKLRTRFVCTVTPIGEARWRLVNLTTE